MSIDKTPHVVETFRMVPDRLTFDERLESHEIRLWCVLCFTARGRDHTDVTDAALAAMTKLSERTVQESLAGLEQCRFIERARRGEGRVITLRPGGDGRAAPELGLRVIG
jgi:hypothetical protein